MPVIEKKLFNLLVDRSWAIDQSKHLSITDLELELFLLCTLQEWEKNFSATDCFTVNGFPDHFWRSSSNTLPALAEHLLVAQTSLVAIWDIARHLLATN